MSRLRWTWMSALAAIALSGCAGRAKVDLLEGRLRQQEDQLLAVQGQLNSSRAELDVARRESHSLREQLLARGEPTLLPEQANVLYRVTGLSINKLLTSGVNRDDVPGDELLSIVLVPHDPDGELLKLPGRVEIAVIDPALGETEQQIGVWSFSVDETRSHWHRGFIGSGYQFELPWQIVPRNSELLVHARFTATDGRKFVASHLVRVTPPPPGSSPGRTPAPLAAQPKAPAAERGFDFPDDYGDFDMSLPDGQSQVRFRPALDAEGAGAAPLGPLPAAVEPGRIDTSDNWTDATIPQYR